MKTSLTGLLQGRITRRSLLAAVLPAAGASVAWAGNAPEDNGTIRLEGTWISITGGSGTIMTLQFIPLDPAGKTAATRLTSVEYSGGSAALLKAFGADSTSDWVGQAVKTGRNTAEVLEQCYGVASGNPPVIKLIMVVSGTFEFPDPETAIGRLAMGAYLPGPDGFPGKVVLPPSPGGVSVTMKRMPLPCPAE